MNGKLSVAIICGWACLQLDRSKHANEEIILVLLAAGGKVSSYVICYDRSLLFFYLSPVLTSLVFMIFVSVAYTVIESCFTMCQNACLITSRVYC